MLYRVDKSFIMLNKLCFTVINYDVKVNKIKISLLNNLQLQRFTCIQAIIISQAPNDIDVKYKSIKCSCD